MKKETKQKLIYLRYILPPVLINCIVLGLFVNTAWVSLLYASRGYWGWFVYRLPEYAVLIPVSVALIPAIFKLSRVLRKMLNK